MGLICLNFGMNMAPSTNNFVGLGFGVSVGILVFFVAREILCWYWKINEILKRMEAQEKKLDYYLQAIDTKMNFICEKGIKVRVVSDIDNQANNDGIR